MFNKEEIKEINYQISGIKEAIVSINKNATKTLNFKVKTGETIKTLQFGTNSFVDVVVAKEIPMQDLLEMILDHIGMEVKVTDAVGEKIELVKKAKTK